MVRMRRPPISPRGVETSTVPGVSRGKGAVSPITRVTLRRGGCFGACPIYEVTLRRRGWSAWRGEMFTPRIGEYRGRVDEDEFNRLADFVARCGFFDWKAEY